MIQLYTFTLPKTIFYFINSLILDLENIQNNILQCIKITGVYMELKYFSILGIFKYQIDNMVSIIKRTTNERLIIC